VSSSNPVPRLAEAIEEGLADDLLARGVGRYCEQLLAKAGRSKIDLVVLGCTHYPLVEGFFRKALPPGTKIMDQPTIVAQSLIGYLDRHPEFRRPAGEAPGVDFLTSGDPIRVREIARRFFGEETPFQHLSGIAPDADLPPEPLPEPLPDPDESESA